MAPLFQARAQVDNAFLGHAADAHAELFEFGDGVQDQAGFSTEAVELVDEELIELAAPGVVENLAAFRTPIQRDGPGNAVIGVKAGNREAVQLTVALSKLALRHDGLALALLLGTDADVNGNGHGDSLGLQVAPLASTT